MHNITVDVSEIADIKGGSRFSFITPSTLNSYSTPSCRVLLVPLQTWSSVA